MTVQHDNFPRPEQWQSSERLELMANFGRFLIQHGERGNRVDPATMEHTSDKTYHLDDFEGVVYRAREQFSGNTDLIHKATAFTHPHRSGQSMATKSWNLLSLASTSLPDKPPSMIIVL